MTFCKYGTSFWIAKTFRFSLPGIGGITGFDPVAITSRSYPKLIIVTQGQSLLIAIDHRYFSDYGRYLVLDKHIIGRYQILFVSSDHTKGIGNATGYRYLLLFSNNSNAFYWDSGVLLLLPQSPLPHLLQ
jgi:hypothetical protein